MVGFNLTFVDDDGDIPLSFLSRVLRSDFGKKREIGDRVDKSPQPIFGDRERFGRIFMGQMKQAKWREGFDGSKAAGQMEEGGGLA